MNTHDATELLATLRNLSDEEVCNYIFAVYSSKSDEQTKDIVGQAVLANSLNA